MIVWFWYQIIPSYLSYYKLHISYIFSHFPYFVQKLHYSSTWKNLFQNYFCFFLALYSCQCIVINSMHFLNINPWFNACFKFLMRIKYIFLLLYKLVKRFSVYPIFIPLGKNEKSLWSSCNSSGYWTSTSRKYPASL